ncbi:Fmu (Sun) domain-containing protein [Sediminibacterium sp.]|uniref:Fmu (Sun) domain-containing protein n=1 Tax=Sediminibacterium sp. TaxID=1917865 RepID=UPI003F6EDF1D
MKYAENYLRSAAAIITAYSGDMPFAGFLKMHFAANKKFGSKDRRYISQICYSYFRTGNSMVGIDLELALKAALYLCNNEPGVWADLFDQPWLTNWSVSLTERIEYVKNHIAYFNPTQIFPFVSCLSKTIEVEKFSQSHLIQPDLFIRVRPGRLPNVIKAFTSNGIAYKSITESCLALPNGTKLEGIAELDKDFVIQDYSSQQTASIMEAAKQLRKGKDASVDVWDCCAASGGKSILARDFLGNMELTVSDIRKSIIQNLAQRFERAGIRKYQSLVVDLSMPITAPELAGMQFDLIICDAPCSGSGTWGRTPEQLTQFSEHEIVVFQQLQQHIVQNALPKLRNNGYFLYITCSVFEAENEAIIPFFENKFPFVKLVEQISIKGYDMKADTMYAALFKKMD